MTKKHTELSLLKKLAFTVVGATVGGLLFSFPGALIGGFLMYHVSKMKFRRGAGKLFIKWK